MFRPFMKNRIKKILYATLAALAKQTNSSIKFVSWFLKGSPAHCGNGKPKVRPFLRFVVKRLVKVWRRALDEIRSLCGWLIYFVISYCINYSKSVLLVNNFLDTNCLDDQPIFLSDSRSTSFV